MATAMHPFTPSRSFNASSSSRPTSTVPPHATHPHAQLPDVDFNFEDLRQRMAAFTVKFDAFIEKGRKRVLEERNEFRGRLGEIEEDQRLKSQSIASMSSATSTHRSVQAREEAERNEMNSAIRALESTHAAHAQTRDRLKQQLAQTQRQIDSKLHAQREYGSKLESQSRLNGPELQFWETCLGVRLEGAGVEDRIKCVFTFEGEKSGRDEREVWFELDLSRRDYEVRAIGGAIREGEIQKGVEGVVDRLNEDRNIGRFLAGMRGLIAKALKA